ncbi:MAG: 6-bladed beta-propeller [Actinomycetota bacterium]
MKKRHFLIIVLVILLLILAALFYLYLTLVRPSQRVVTPEIKGIEHLFSIYGYGDKPDQLLSRPHGVAVDRKGNIYISDQKNDRILVFDEKGKFLFKFGKKGEGLGEFTAPMGIAVSPKGRIYVTDRLQSKVFIFDSKGKFIKEFRVMMPLIPRIAHNKLYLTTYGHVIIYDLDGNELAKWGRRGRDKGEFDFPNGIAIGKEGNVYVSDSNNLRLQALDKDGEVLWVVGKPSKDIWALERRFGLPAGLAIDEDQRLYLVDAFHYSIRVLTNKGKELANLGGELGDKPGQFYYAADIAYAGDGVFIVSDKYNDRVQVVRVTVE